MSLGAATMVNSMVSVMEAIIAVVCFVALIEIMAIVSM